MSKQESNNNEAKVVENKPAKGSVLEKEQVAEIVEKVGDTINGAANTVNSQLSSVLKGSYSLLVLALIVTAVVAATHDLKILLLPGVIIGVGMYTKKGAQKTEKPAVKSSDEKDSGN